MEELVEKLVELLSEFSEPAECVGQLHLARSPALELEYPWRPDENGHALGSRRRDVKAVQAVEELHAAGRISMRRGRQRVDRNGRLLPLELVDRADPSSRQLLLDLEYLRIIGRDDQDLGGRDWVRCALAVGPGRTTP